jgi:RimJ/RimL family protein N-acetyltransferase
LLKRLQSRRLLLRPATRQDLIVLRDLIAAAPPGLASPGLAGEVAPAALEQLLQAAAVDRRRQLLVIEEKGPGVVGLILVRLHQPWAGAAFVELLLLAPQVRGRGYGREACEAWQAWARKKERIVEFQAAVSLIDLAASSFWAALGYRDTGEIRKDDAGSSFRILSLRAAPTKT